jgi:hypothetical protein
MLKTMVTRNATCVTRPTRINAGERKSRLSAVLPLAFSLPTAGSGRTADEATCLAWGPPEHGEVKAMMITP